jgi:hypothetical protein
MPVFDYDIAVTLNAADRLQVFVVGDTTGRVYTGDLIGAVNHTTDLLNLLGPAIGGPAGPSTFEYHQLAVGRNTDGMLELFALSDDGRVYHVKQKGQSWGQWTDIGAVNWKQIIIGTNADGRLEVFALVDGGQVVHIWQESPSGNWTRIHRMTH